MQQMLVLKRDSDNYRLALLSVKFISFLSIDNNSLKSFWQQSPNDFAAFSDLSDALVLSNGKNVHLDVSASIALCKLFDLTSKLVLSSRSAEFETILFTLAADFFADLSDKKLFISYYLKTSTMLFNNLKETYGDDYPELLSLILNQTDFGVV